MKRLTPLVISFVIILPSLCYSSPFPWSMRQMALGTSFLTLDDKDSKLSLYNLNNPGGLLFEQQFNSIHLGLGYFNESQDESSSEQVIFAYPGSNFQGLTHWLSSHMVIQTGLTGVYTEYQSDPSQLKRYPFEGNFTFASAVKLHRTASLGMDIQFNRVFNSTLTEKDYLFKGALGTAFVWNNSIIPSDALEFGLTFHADYNGMIAKSSQPAIGFSGQIIYTFADSYKMILSNKYITGEHSTTSIASQFHPYSTQSVWSNDLLAAFIVTVLKNPNAQIEAALAYENMYTTYESTVFHSEINFTFFNQYTFLYAFRHINDIGYSTISLEYDYLPVLTFRAGYAIDREILSGGMGVNLPLGLTADLTIRYIAPEAYSVVLGTCLPY